MLDYNNHREKVHAHYFASIMELDTEILTAYCIQVKERFWGGSQGEQYIVH